MDKTAHFSDNWGKKNIEYLKNAPIFTEDKHTKLMECNMGEKVPIHRSGPIVARQPKSRRLKKKLIRGR